VIKPVRVEHVIHIGEHIADFVVPSLHPGITSWNRINRAIKRRIRASQHFRSFWGAWRTIAGYEAIHMIRKGQACWLESAGVKVGLLHRFVEGSKGNTFCNFPADAIFQPSWASIGV
jgi:hypothetical protein